MPKTLKSLSTLILLLLASTIVLAENSTQVPGYKIHHNAIATAILTPEIARNYGIVRSKYRGLINISIIKTAAGTIGTPVEAVITAKWRNLIGKIQALSLRKVTEGSAIYYIGEFPIVNGEKLIFNLEIKPMGQPKTYKTELNQEFYID